MIEILLISIFLICINTIGQIYLKKATLNRGRTKRYLLIGYMLFIVAIIVSFYLMKIIELKYFTVIMSSIYLTVLISSTLLFKEQLDKSKILGTVFVILGIIIFIGG